MRNFCCHLVILISAFVLFGCQTSSSAAKVTDCSFSYPTTCRKLNGYCVLKEGESLELVPDVAGTYVSFFIQSATPIEQADGTTSSQDLPPGFSLDPGSGKISGALVKSKYIAYSPTIVLKCGGGGTFHLGTNFWVDR